jgi:hypothetical protein
MQTKMPDVYCMYVPPYVNGSSGYKLACHNKIEPYTVVPKQEEPADMKYILIYRVERDIIL